MPTLWQWTTEVGRTAGVLDYELSWPAEEIDGYVVTRRETGGVYPQDLDTSGVGELDRMSLPDGCPTSPDAKIWQQQWRQMHRVFGLAAVLRARYPTDLFVVYTHATDSIGHRFWKYFEPHVFTDPNWSLDERQVDCFGAVIPDFLEKTDELVGRILKAVGDEAVVIVASDHGMRAKRRVNPTMLYDPLYRALGLQRRDAQGVLLGGTPSLVSVDPVSFDRFEWARWVDVGGEPAAPDESERKRVAGLLAGLRAQPGDAPLFREVRLNDGRGDELSQAPDRWDLLLIENERLQRRSAGRRLMVDGKERDLTDFLRPDEVSGTHSPKGIFLASGPCIRRDSTMLELSGVDLTPTILHLLGTAVPKGLDGRVMEEILEEECLERSPVRYRDSDLFDHPDDS